MSNWDYVYGETKGKNFNTGALRVYQSKDKKVGLMRTYSHGKLKKEVYFPWNNQDLDFSSDKSVRDWLKKQ